MTSIIIEDTTKGEQVTGVIKIHTSDRLSFKRCRRRWTWLSDLRTAIKPIEQPRPLSFGTAFHTAMQYYYNPDTWAKVLDPATRPIIIEGAIMAGLEEIKAAKKRYLRLTGMEALDDEDQTKYLEDLELLEGMCRNYFDVVSKKALDEFTPVAVEIGFEVRIYTDEEEQLWFPWLPQGVHIVYCGRVDLLMHDRKGLYWIWDHKSTARMRDNMTALELDEQLGSYNWALEYMLGIAIEGNMYAEIHKSFPQPLPENKHVRLGRRFSIAKNQSTSYEVAKAQLEAEGEPLELYADFLNWLKVEGTTYVRRTAVRRNRHELMEMHERIKMEVRDMLNPDLLIYPSPSPFSCDNCPCRMPCLATNDGSDPQWILDTYFVKEKRSNA
jgi:hypothetical protein